MILVISAVNHGKLVSDSTGASFHPAPPSSFATDARCRRLPTSFLATAVMERTSAVVLRPPIDTSSRAVNLRIPCARRPQRPLQAELGRYKGVPAISGTFLSRAK
jgi:hypothetical protein